MRIIASSALNAAKSQQLPHPPWLFTADTPPSVRQLKLSGRSRAIGKSSGSIASNRLRTSGGIRVPHRFISSS